MTNLDSLIELTKDLAAYIDTVHMIEGAFLQANEAIVITDANLEPPGPTILFVNYAFEKMTGFSKEEVIGKSPRILQGAKTDRELLDTLKSNLLNGLPFFGRTVNYRKDGSEYILEWHIAPIYEKEKIIRYVSIQRSLTELPIVSKEELSDLVSKINAT